MRRFWRKRSRRCRNRRMRCRGRNSIDVELEEPVHQDEEQEVK